MGATQQDTDEKIEEITAKQKGVGFTIKKVNVPCSFGGAKSPFTIYIGYPKDDSPHPLYFQRKWTQDKNGVIPEAILQSIDDIYKISQKNKLDFPSLFSYAMQLANYKKKVSNPDEQRQPLKKSTG